MISASTTHSYCGVFFQSCSLCFEQKHNYVHMVDIILTPFEILAYQSLFSVVSKLSGTICHISFNDCFCKFDFYSLFFAFWWYYIVGRYGIQ